jgi:hypothetical protein
MAHQRRAPGRDESTKTSGQLSPAHSRIRSARGPDSRSIISRAIVESDWVARTGAVHPTVLPSTARCGTSGGTAAARLMVATVAASTGCPGVGRLPDRLAQRLGRGQVPGRHRNRHDRREWRLGQPFAKVGRVVKGLEHGVPAFAAGVGEVQADGAGVEPERPSIGVVQHPSGCVPAHETTITGVRVKPL